VGRAEVAAVGAVLRSGWLGTRRETARFERRFAGHVGARHCVATSSGTAALQLAVALLDLEPSDEVVVPALTFVATAHAVRYAGARVVLADVAPATLTLDPEDLARKITPRTRAVIPVHYGGHPCAMDAIHAVAAAADLTVIEDAAHAAGASYRGRRVGTLSRLTCFSFHAAKNMTTGEGGAITCASASDCGAPSPFARPRDVARYLRPRAPRGAARAAGLAVRRCRELGYKAAMHDLAAAIGIVQLAKLAGLNARPARARPRYVEAFADLEWLETPRVAPWAESAHYSFPIRVRAGRRWRALRRARHRDRVHYRPLHRHPLYRDRARTLPVTDALWRQLLLLPLHPGLGRAAQDRVIAAVRSFDRRVPVRSSTGASIEWRATPGPVALRAAPAGGGAERARRSGVCRAGRRRRMEARPDAPRDRLPAHRTLARREPGARGVDLPGQPGSEAREEADCAFLMRRPDALGAMFAAPLDVAPAAASTIYVGLHLGSPVLGYLYLCRRLAPDLALIARGIDPANPMPRPSEGSRSPRSRGPKRRRDVRSTKPTGPRCSAFAATFAPATRSTCSPTCPATPSVARARAHSSASRCGWPRACRPWRASPGARCRRSS
jgi:perosamine synthetase